MEKLHIQTFSSAHAALGTSRLRILGRAFLLAAWQREGKKLVLGEAAPLLGYGDDNLGRAEAALRRLSSVELQEITRAAVKGFSNDEKGLLLSRTSPLGIVEAWSSQFESPSARFCAEMLVLGAVAGECGVPLWRLLASECVAPSLRTSAVVDPLSPSWFAEFAANHARGIRTFKFKCGRDAVQEKEALARALCAEGVRLRLDPNGSWNMSEAESFLCGIPPDVLEWVEDPTQEMVHWGPLRGRTGVALALDEPLARGLRPEQAGELGPDVVVLKPMALGGFSACVRWAAWARAHQASVCVSHLFDGNAAMSATIHLAFAIQSSHFAAGLGQHVALSSDPSGAPPAPGLTANTMSCPGATDVGELI